ncbi:MAG: hypothetical protein KF729_33430 [Sandaracinaceae bacterium]|nr:hypothetical protein [Sandaracinaceae bacterium]
MAVRRRLVASLLFCLCSVGLSARAQTDARLSCAREPSNEAEARALFVAGVAATNQERWADAIPSLRRAYELSCHSSALYNLGYSLRALGRHREARDAFAQLLSDHTDLPGELRDNAVRYLDQERARVAVLELLDIEPDLRPRIIFDGREVPDEGARPVRIETDAGTHALALRLDGHEPYLWNGELADGQNLPILVRFVPLATGGGDFEWGWIVLGVVAAAVVAGAIGLGVALQDAAQLAPLSDRTVRIGGS